MKTFETIPKRWGNSIGITIPKEIIEEEKIKPNGKVMVFITTDKKNILKETFGTLKWKKPTQQIIDEIDEGWDEH